MAVRYLTANRGQDDGLYCVTYTSIGTIKCCTRPFVCLSVCLSRAYDLLKIGKL